MNIESIILKNQKVNERDLNVYVLTKSNQFHWIKIPGILKSQKRSAYLYVSGTIWEFLISNSTASIWFSKEAMCTLQPFGENVQYQDLLFIQKLLEPILIVDQEQMIDLYSTMFYILSFWSLWTENQKYYSIGRVYIKVLKEIGLLDLNIHCQFCNSKLDDNIDLYLLGIGNTCMKCYQQQYQISDYRMVPLSTIIIFLRSFSKDIIYEYEVERCISIKKYLKIYG